MTPRIELTDQATAAEISAVRELLDRYNAQASGIDDRRALAVLLRDPATDQVIGGLTGRTSRGMLFVEVVFVPPELRGTGIGAQLLRMAEDEGYRRGCRQAMLHTNTFQAPHFYPKQGWVEFGRFDCAPPGNQRICFAKVLQPPR